MNVYTLSDTILGEVDNLYPAEERPAQNAYLKSLYQPYPDLTPGMIRANLEAAACIRRVWSACPHLSELEAEAAGMEQFCEQFAEQLAEDALGTFSARQ